MADTKLDKRLKLSGALPAESAVNGIDYLAAPLVANPAGTMVIAVCVLDVRQVVYDLPSDAHVPTLRIQRVEAVLLDEAPPAVRAWLDARQAERLGADELSLYDDEDSLSDPLEDAHLADAVAVLPHDADKLVRAPFGVVR